MRGHEYIRDTLLDVLAERVPERLAAHLADIEQTEPAPESLRFVLADSLQDLTDSDFPVVAVRSSEADDEQKVSSRDWMFVYPLEVMVACDHQAYGPEGFEQASRARDRLLLAVRESLLTVSGAVVPGAADGQVEFLPGKRREAVGRGNQQTLAGLALAVGTLALRARVQERLADLTSPETVGAVDLTVAGADASQVL